MDGSAGAEFDAFMSYSQAADGRLAPALQQGLHRLAKPWWRRRALRVFRDSTGLAVTPALWPAIETALDRSRWFVVLCSPDAAASPWVAREIGHWRAAHGSARILPVVTGGQWRWDKTAGDFDPEDCSAIPPALFGAFDHEPLLLDLRFAAESDMLDLRDRRFRDAVAALAAPLHGRDKDELESEDVRQQRTALRTASAALATMAVLLVAALVAGVLAAVNANRAGEQSELATARFLASQSRLDLPDHPDRALLLAVEALRRRDLPETRSALLGAIAAGPRAVLHDEPGATPVLAYVSPTVLVAGRADGALSVWDVAAGRHVTRISTAHVGGVSALAVSPDGRSLASAGADGQVVVWKIDGWAPAARARIGAPVRSVAFSSNGSRIAAGDEQGGLWTVDSGSGRSSALAEGLEGAVTSVAFTETGTVYAATGHGMVYRWAPGEKREQVRLQGLQEPRPGSVTAVAVINAVLSPGAQRVALGRDDGQVSVWDLPGGKPSGNTLAGSTSPAEWMVFSPDGDEVVAADGTSIRMWQTDGWFVDPARSGHSLAVRGIAVAADDDTVVSAGDDGRLELWSMRRRFPAARLWFEKGTSAVDHDPYIRTFGPNPKLTFGANSGAFNGVAATPDGLILISDAPVGVQLWRPDAAQQRPTVDPGDRWQQALAVTTDGSRFVTGGAGKVVKVWDTASAGLVGELTLTSEVVDLAISDDGRTVVAADGASGVVVWSVGGGHHRFAQHTPGPASSGHPQLSVRVAITSDGGTAVSAGGDKKMTFYDVAALRPVASVAVPESDVGDLAFSPDGRTLAAARGTELTVWETATRSQRRAPVVSGLDQRLTALAFSPDGTTVAAGGFYGVDLFSTSDVTRLGGPIVGVRNVSALTFTDAGRRLVAVGEQIMMIDTDPQTWTARACAAAGRYLTDAEWAQFIGVDEYRPVCGPRQ